MAMRFKRAIISVVLVLSIGALPVALKSQRNEGRLGNTRYGTATTLPNFGDMLQRLVEEMSEDFDSARAETSEPRMQRLLEETEAFALRLEELYYASISENGSPDGLGERADDLEAATLRLTDLVNSGTEPPRINVAPLPAEPFDVRVRRLVNLSRRIIPNILFLVGADSVNLDLLNQIRDDLAITGALSNALSESAF